LPLAGALGISSGPILQVAGGGGEAGPREATLIALVRHVRRKPRKEDTAMLYDALVFLIVGLIAGALGLFGIAPTSRPRLFET